MRPKIPVFVENRPTVCITDCSFEIYDFPMTKLLIAVGLHSDGGPE